MNELNLRISFVILLFLIINIKACLSESEKFDKLSNLNKYYKGLASDEKIQITAEDMINFISKCKNDNYENIWKNKAADNCFNVPKSLKDVDCMNQLGQINGAKTKFLDGVCGLINKAKSCIPKVANLITLRVSKWNGCDCSQIKTDVISFANCAVDFYAEKFNCPKNSSSTLNKNQLFITSILLLMVIRGLYNKMLMF
jgi:hypothetical protein